MPIKLHTIGVVVKDMAKTVAFYRALGLSIPEGEEHAPHVEVTSADGYTIGFDTEEAVIKTDANWRKPEGGQRINLQFGCGSPAEVDAIYETLIALGAGNYRAPWDAFWGQRFGRITDPDGNVVSLFAEL